MTAYYDPRADWSRDDVEAARPALETLVEVLHQDHLHYSVTERDVCELDWQHWVAQAELEREAEAEADYDAWIEQGERDADAIAHGSIDWRAACNLLGLDADWSMS